jgi:undecaprenyl diphosphate synthase
MSLLNAQTDIERLKQTIDLSRLPEHVAIIMDGNGRWARERGLFRIQGHQRGYQTVRQIVRDAGEFGIKVLTLYVFSVENWKRPKSETDALMRLIEHAARHELNELKENNVQIRFVGRRAGLPQSLINEMNRDIEETRANTGLVLNLAINYGGRAEIVDAVKSIADDVKSGKICSSDIDERLIGTKLYAPDLPDPDLLIRTAGEMRVSNFLLWGVAYSELWVTNSLWPDFNASLLADAIRDYQSRVRKFGSVAND